MTNPVFSTFLTLTLTTMYYTYIIYSRSVDKFYVGQSANVELRLEFHNSGESRYTSKANDWELVHVEEYLTRTEAIKRENEIKRKKSRKYIEHLLS